jgi:hypothetical protein
MAQSAVSHGVWMGLVVRTGRLLQPAPPGSAQGQAAGFAPPRSPMASLRPASSPAVKASSKIE